MDLGNKRTQYFGSKNQPVEVNDLLQKEPLTKRILIVDDDPDITYTFKEGIEYYSSISGSIKVYTYNDPLLALSEFKPNYYDLMLLDINLPGLN